MDTGKSGDFTFAVRGFGLVATGYPFHWRVALSVGKVYSSQTFITEAQTMGVSKRIAGVPKDLVIGETWVYLVHRKAIDKGNQMGIFSAFRPTHLEMLIWQSEAIPEKLEELKKRGITAVIVPDGDKDHAKSLPKKTVI